MCFCTKKIFNYIILYLTIVNTLYLFTNSQSDAHELLNKFLHCPIYIYTIFVVVCFMVFLYHFKKFIEYINTKSMQRLLLNSLLSLHMYMACCNLNILHILYAWKLLSKLKKIQTLFNMKKTNLIMRKNCLY